MAMYVAWKETERSLSFFDIEFGSGSMRVVHVGGDLSI